MDPEKSLPALGPAPADGNYLNFDHLCHLTGTYYQQNTEIALVAAYQCETPPPVQKMGPHSYLASVSDDLNPSVSEQTHLQQTK